MTHDEATLRGHRRAVLCYASEERFVFERVTESTDPGACGTQRGPWCAHKVAFIREVKDRETGLVIRRILARIDRGERCPPGRD